MARWTVERDDGTKETAPNKGTAWNKGIAYCHRAYDRGAKVAGVNLSYQGKRKAHIWYDGQLSYIEY